MAATEQQDVEILVESADTVATAVYNKDKGEDPWSTKVMEFVI